MKTRKERIEFGKNRRSKLSRTSQANTGVANRRLDSMQILTAAGKDRVTSLLAVKYARMSASPFAFFRGAVSVMAADFALRPNSGMGVQLCGDAHVQNMGSFASPDGRLTFDINDFDETTRGPWEWDVKRMATSIVLAGNEAGQSRAACREATEHFVEVYSGCMRQFAYEPAMEVARHMIHRGGDSRPVHAALRQSQRNRPLDVLAKYTQNRKSGRTFVDRRPVLWRVRGREARQVLASLPRYRESLSPERRHLFDQYQPVDVGFKVVGTGSVGLRDYIVLLEGNGPKDPLFLQIKQQVKSAYAGYLRAPAYTNQGQRVAEGQRAIQPASDPLLGWTACVGHQYLVRQLNDHKGSIDFETLRGDGLMSIANVAGELLARGHARSGDCCAIHGYCGSGGKLAEAIADFAMAYAERTEADYAAALPALKKASRGIGAV